MFKPGDMVRRISTGEEGIVRDTLPGGFCEVGFAPPTGVSLCPDSDLEPLSAYTAGAEPGDRLRRGELSASELYGLHLQSVFLRHAFKYDERAGLSAARVEPMLHQIYVTLQVLRKLHPRMILADEVGLGKTIEAGLIIKELRARGLADRVLVICPASLVDQWQQELSSKFNEDFVVYNREALSFHQRKGNPWEQEGSIICSLPFATRHRAAIAEAHWDLVIFDEAHKLNRRRFGKKWNATKAWELADELKDEVEGLLLLTATPMQLDVSQLYSLLDLVEPGLFGSLSDYERRRREMPEVSMIVGTIEAWEGLSDAKRSEFLEARRANPTVGLSQVILAGLDSLADRDGRERLIDELLRAHPLAGVMVRNRKSEIGGFRRRFPFTHPIAMSVDEQALYGNVTEYIQRGYDRARKEKNLAISFLMVAYQKMLSSSSAALVDSFKRRVGKLKARLAGDAPAGTTKATRSDYEEWVDALEVSDVITKIEDAVLPEQALELEIKVLERFVGRLQSAQDSKGEVFFAAASRILEGDPHEKILVFTQFIETQRYLANGLEDRGYRVSLFNGGQSNDEKREAVRYFRDEGQVLVSTEAGGEGRNFQFCHIMFNYDLPWNPMRVEQRIGRLDRIGQERDIQIHNLAAVGTVEERILSVLERRIQLFEESVGGLDPILGEVEREIESFAMGEDDSRIDEVERSLEEQMRRVRARESAEQDLAMDRNSLRRDEANAWLNRKPMADWADLAAYSGAALDYFGGRLAAEARGAAKLITLSPKLGVALRVGKPKYVGDFDPARALAREELDFFAFGHEVIDGLVDMPGREAGACTGARRLAEGREGVNVEVFYEISGTGTGRVGRLLRRGRLIRHEVGPDGEVRSERVDSMPEIGEPVREVDVPEWAGRALDASWLTFTSEDYASEVADLQAEIERHRADELERAGRIQKHKATRVRQRIREQETWLKDNRDSTSEKIQKVLPAREGLLAKAQDDLARLEAEYEQQVQEIRRAGAGLNSSMVAAGLVIHG